MDLLPRLKRLPRRKSSLPSGAMAWADNETASLSRQPPLRRLLPHHVPASEGNCRSGNILGGILDIECLLHCFSCCDPVLTGVLAFLVFFTVAILALLRHSLVARFSIAVAQSVELSNIEGVELKSDLVKMMKDEGYDVPAVRLNVSTLPGDHRRDSRLG